MVDSGTTSSALGCLAFSINCSIFPAHIRQIALIQRAQSPGANSEPRSWLVSSGNAAYLLWAIAASDETVFLARATGLVFAYLILMQLIRFGAPEMRKLKLGLLLLIAMILLLSPWMKPVLEPYTAALGTTAVSLSWFALVFGNLHQNLKLRRAEHSERRIVAWQQKTIVFLRHIVWIPYAIAVINDTGWTPLLIHTVGAIVYGWTLWELRPRRSHQ